MWGCLLPQELFITSSSPRTLWLLQPNSEAGVASLFRPLLPGRSLPWAGRVDRLTVQDRCRRRLLTAAPFLSSVSQAPSNFEQTRASVTLSGTGCLLHWLWSFLFPKAFSPVRCLSSDSSPWCCPSWVGHKRVQGAADTTFTS